MANLLERKIAAVIAFRDFRDEEYFIPKKIIESAGFSIETVSNKKGIAFGAAGGEVEVDLLLNEVNLSDFEAIVFSGGSGCLKYLDNDDSYSLVRKTVDSGKVLGSICISPVILAKAGVLNGKKATVWNSPLDKFGIKILNDFGAIYEDKPVVVDGKIITAAGPFAAKEFAEEIIKNVNRQ